MSERPNGYAELCDETLIALDSGLADKIRRRARHHVDAACADNAGISIDELRAFVDGHRNLHRRTLSRLSTFMGMNLRHE